MLGRNAQTIGKKDYHSFSGWPPEEIGARISKISVEPPVSGWAQTEVLFEGMVEIRMIRPSDLLKDFADPKRCRAQQSSRLLKAATNHVLFKANTDLFFEERAKSRGTKRDFLRHLGESNPLLEAHLEKLERLPDPRILDTSSAQGPPVVSVR